MSKLVANVLVDGEGYGPAYGNESKVPADVVRRITNPAAWDKVPAAAKPAEPPGDFGWLNQEAAQGAARADLLAGLAAVPDDKDQLLAFAEAHGLDVDNRLGPEKLRDAIAEAVTTAPG